MASSGPVYVEYMSSHIYRTALSAAHDPFRHKALANSHNHHDLHPWGKAVVSGSREFNALYAEANNRYMYHLWYSPTLAPYMATDMVTVVPISEDTMSSLVSIVHVLLASGIDAAMDTAEGHSVVKYLTTILDEAGISPEARIFVRLSATSTKDSFALNVPTTKPDPLQPDANAILRRLLTSGRSVGRLLSLSEKVWPADPGEAIIVQHWAPEIDLSREIRCFCYEGRVTAISQDVWWEKMGWRDRYSDGFVQAVMTLWENVKGHLPFDTCTMDVLITTPDKSPTGKWVAQIIEFNGFGAHLNTGSDLFHWVNDRDILYGKRPGITLRFVDDWEQTKDEVFKTKYSTANRRSPEIQSNEDATMQQETVESEPDWLVLEKKLRQTYSDSAKSKQRLEMEERTKLPLRGRWCSAY